MCGEANQIWSIEIPKNYFTQVVFLPLKYCNKKRHPIERDLEPGQQ